MKLPYVFFILLISAIHSQASESIIHSDNKLFELKGSSLEQLNIEPAVKFYSSDKKTICYLQCKNADSEKMTLGLFDISEKKILIEKGLPYECKNFSIIKFYYINGSAYIFSKNPDNIKSVLKINLDDFSESNYNDIEDFSIISGAAWIIEKRNSSYQIKTGNSEIPLIYNNPPQFQTSINDRIVIISDGEIYDFIDISNKKILFSSNISKVNPGNDKFNFEISITDESIPDKDNDSSRLAFYKIFIDGTESGRTESGYIGIEKNFRENLLNNAYHTVKIELWELNSGKNKYERANNVRQPSSLKLFIPNGRKIRLKVQFDGTSYKSTLE